MAFRVVARAELELILARLKNHRRPPGACVEAGLVPTVQLRGHGGVVALAVEVARRAHGTVVEHLPAGRIGHDRLGGSVRVGHLKHGEKGLLGAVEAPVGNGVALVAAPPALGELRTKRVVPGSHELGHVVHAIGHVRGVVLAAGAMPALPHALAVDRKLIDALCRGVQRGARDLAGRLELRTHHGGGAKRRVGANEHVLVTGFHHDVVAVQAHAVQVLKDGVGGASRLGEEVAHLVLLLVAAGIAQRDVGKGRRFPGGHRKADLAQVGEGVVIVRVAQRVYLTCLVDHHAVDGAVDLVDLGQGIDVDLDGVVHGLFRQRLLGDAHDVGGLGLVTVVLRLEGRHAHHVDVELGLLCVGHVHLVHEAALARLAPNVHGLVCQAIVVRAEHDARARAVRRNRNRRIEREVVGDGRVEVHALRADPLRALPRIDGAVRKRRGKRTLARLELVAVHVGDRHLPGVAALGVKRVAAVGDVLAFGTFDHAAVPHLLARRIGNDELVGCLTRAHGVGGHSPTKGRHALDAHGVDKTIDGKAHDLVALVELVDRLLGRVRRLLSLLLGGRRSV